MPILLSDYETLLECKGNKHNKVHIVRHKETRERCILKVIDIYDKESQLREIEVHKRLQHKYVISLLDYEVKDDKIIMLIELAKHGDLYSILPKIDKLGEARMIKMYYRILRALQYLHAHGYVHRDIKPENILVTKKLRPKLADFGTSASKDLIANTFCGTYEYMAPEVYLRCQQTDRVDVWSAGILLYELTHKRTPFRDDTLQSMKHKLDSKSLYFKPDTSSLVKDFIYKALRFNSKDRPDINELLEHKLFDNVRPQSLSRSPPKLASKLKSQSMRDLAGMRTQSQKNSNSSHKNSGSPMKSRAMKLPVHTMIFDSESSNKVMNSSIKRANISEYLKKLRKVREPETKRRVLPYPTKKPLVKPIKLGLQPTKPKLKTLLELNIVSAKKQANANSSFKNHNLSATSKNTTIRHVQAPSLSNFSLKLKNTCGNCYTPRDDLLDDVYNLYEKKEKFRFKAGSITLK